MDKIRQKLVTWQKEVLKAPEFNFVKKLLKSFPEAKIYLVGGVVRDALIGRPTKDFDFVVAKVDAKKLEKFFSELGEVNLVGKSFGVFKFVPDGFRVGENNFEAIDIALPRTEVAGMSGGYKDFEVQSDKDLPIEKDLSRRDFTINALAWDLVAEKLIDLFGGVSDIEKKTIKAIGKPVERFQEDYTRMLRAIRLSCQLGFTIESQTYVEIKKKAKQIKTIAGERINEELTKIIMSERAEVGIRMMQDIGLLKELIPELENAYGVSQNRHHIYDVFEHSVRALGAGAERGYKLEVRLAALLHDIGKPQTKEGNGVDSTFYNHDIVGAKMAKKILKRLNFSNDIIDYVTHLVRFHMFYYALDIVSDSGVRRLLSRIGRENIDDFINLRICDRLGMGRPKAKPWKLIELERRFKEVQLDPITPKMIALKGDELMKLLGITPGPRVGLILNAMLGEVLDDPAKNDHDYLVGRAKELHQMKDAELKQLNPDVKFYEEERKRNLHQEK
ncbi:MAG: Multifunctional CCA protein [Parcubacteria group bacterium ADurb.Bin326]|nr:MAG: Multifunctional CCA protein [Parcubacteria group bacterium ADurb.Bin326]